MSKSSLFLSAQACPRGTFHHFCQKIKGLCGGINAPQARLGFSFGPSGNDAPYLSSFFNNTRTPRWQTKEELHIEALRTQLAEDEKWLSLREALFGALYQLQGPINLIAAAQNTLRRRNRDHQHDALIEAMKQVLDAGLASVTTLKNSIPPIDTKKPSPVSVNQVLFQALSLMTAVLRENKVMVHWYPASELPPLNGSETRMRAMFKQLIENAIDAMRNGDGLGRELSVYSCSDGAEIHVCIEDTGPGIPEHLQTKVFEPFFSTKTRGTQRHAGMGLTWVKEVVNQHRGFIQIDPGYAEGCRIHIQLPTSQ